MAFNNMIGKIFVEVQLPDGSQVGYWTVATSAGYAMYERDGVLMDYVARHKDFPAGSALIDHYFVNDENLGGGPEYISERGELIVRQ